MYFGHGHKTQLLPFRVLGNGFILHSESLKCLVTNEKSLWSFFVLLPSCQLFRNHNLSDPFVDACGDNTPDVDSSGMHKELRSFTIKNALL